MLNKLLPILAASALLAAAAVPAQETSPPSVDQMLNLMTAKLALTDDQKRAIAPVIEERQAKLKALRDADTGRRERRREARTILEDGDKKINAVLTADQQRQYKELEHQMIERLREQRSQAQ